VEAPAERLSAREGFTLVEVLVAMIILAVGLLALEAMAIGAARTVAMADRQSEYTTLASAQMEQVLQRIQLGQNPGSAQGSVHGAQTHTVVTRQPAGAGHFVYTVQVTVTPPPNQRFNLNPITVVGRAIQPVVP
jgi:prepilin-type N-terminal cleavage/methylation domain-containing protein